MENDQQDTQPDKEYGVLGLNAGQVTKSQTAAMEHPTPRGAELDWRCGGHPTPEIFYPVDEHDLGTAKALCRACPMRATCLALGEARGEWGVWGGVLLERGQKLAGVRKPGRPRKEREAAAA